MVERAEREPTMEEIVVSLRETRRDASRIQPLAVTGLPRSNRTLRTMGGQTDLTDLRDGEIERLLSENARLNSRVLSLLKVIEHEQACLADAVAAAEAAAEPASSDADRDSIYREVRSALEAELSPVLLVLLRLLEKQRGDPAAGDHPHHVRRRVAGSAAQGGPSDWIVDLMHKLETEPRVRNETIAATDGNPRRPKLRQRMADVVNALRFDPYAVPPRRRFASPEETL
jgi:hypothetical protein